MTSTAARNVKRAWLKAEYHAKKTSAISKIFHFRPCTAFAITINPIATTAALPTKPPRAQRLPFQHIGDIQLLVQRHVKGIPDEPPAIGIDQQHRQAHSQHGEEAIRDPRD